MTNKEIKTKCEGLYAEIKSAGVGVRLLPGETLIK